MSVCLDRFATPGLLETRPTPQVICPRCGVPSVGLCQDCRFDDLAYRVQYMTPKDFLDLIDDALDGCEKNFYAEDTSIIALEYYDAMPEQVKIAQEFLEAKGCKYTNTGNSLVIYLKISDFL